MDLEKMEKNFHTIISLMESIKADDLILERKYLPEFIDDSLIIMHNTPDGYPILKPDFKIFLIKKGIFVECKELLIQFLKKDDLEYQRDSYDYKIENVVATVTLEITEKIDLKLVARKYGDVEYDPERFPALIMRTQDPKATFLIFSTGKIVVTGLRRTEDAVQAAKKAIEKIKKAGIIVANSEITIQNIVASGDLHANIDLNKAAIVMENTTYEPEVSPGVVYRLQDSKVVFLIFSTGKFICTGAKDKMRVNKEILIFKERMKEFRR